MKQLEGTPIPSHEAVKVMAQDAETLRQKDKDCPLARAIDKALAALQVAIDAHKD